MRPSAPRDPADAPAVLLSTETFRVEALPVTDPTTDHTTDAVALVGELDLEHADAMLEVLLARVDARPARLDIVLDRLEFIDSFGISRLIMTQQAATAVGVELVLRGARPTTRRVLVVSGLITFLNVIDDR